MRSIRRSLLGYLLLLLVLAFSGVLLLVDRFANAAILAREQAETRRIQEAFVVRQKEAKDEFDARLQAEVHSLAHQVQNRMGELGASSRLVRFAQEPRPTAAEIRARDEEIDQYTTRTTMLQLGSGFSGWQSAVTAAAIDPPHIPIFPPRTQSSSRGGVVWLRRLSPTWAGFDGPRAVRRIQEALKPMFDDDEHSDYFQFTMLVSFTGQPGNGMVATVRGSRVPQDLPPPGLEPRDRNGSREFAVDDIELPEVGKLRRAVRLPVLGRRPSLMFWIYLAPPHPSAGSGVPLRMAPRPNDLFVRVYVHHARPYSELMASLAEERKDVEDQLEGVHEGSVKELNRLRTRLLAIGGVTFLALVLGGWVIVARGLAPVKKLSDAVSLVSEKDFRLPVALTEMSRELAPVHARLNQTLDQLREAFAREKQAVADISHELRTPIASLLATIDVSLRKPRTPEQYRNTLEDCRAIAKQLGQLVERIMTLASLDAGTAHTSVQQTDAAELVTGCAAVIRPLAEAHGLTLQVEVEEGLELTTDRDKLREVLMNLLHNAVEYNQPGGRLDFNARRDGDSVVFEIRDTGIGVPADLREKIFERFFRADASRHATGVHAGLGLAIVKEYVQRLNGTITLQSETNVGSTFTVRLPAAAPPDGSTPPPQPAPEQSEVSAPSAKSSNFKRRTYGEVTSSRS
jgi:signal transduction histidine kinase